MSSPTVHEAYSFACLRCGDAWEAEYEIRHVTDLSGRTKVVYYRTGRRVPSPLTHPRCDNCGGTTIRILRSGRVQALRAAGY